MAILVLRQAPAQQETCDTESENEVFTQYGFEFNGGLVAWDDRRDESQRYFNQFLHYSHESKGWSWGGAESFSRFDFDGRPTDQLRVEGAGSYQFRADCPWKVRLLGYASYSDVDVADVDLLQSRFDPTGSRTTMGILGRWRTQDDEFPDPDSLFIRPTQFPDATVGYQYLWDRTEGEDLYSNGWVFHADYRQPFARGTAGVLKLALAYGKTDHPRRTSNQDTSDTQFGGRATYSLPLRIDNIGRLDFLMFVDNTMYSSSLRELNGREIAMGVGIHWGSEWWDEGSGPTPENEGSSTTSPGDLGPPRPRP